jgi:hypothetical protein
MILEVEFPKCVFWFLCKCWLGVWSVLRGETNENELECEGNYESVV